MALLNLKIASDHHEGSAGSVTYQSRPTQANELLVFQALRNLSIKFKPFSSKHDIGEFEGLTHQVPSARTFDWQPINKPEPGNWPSPVLYWYGWQWRAISASPIVRAYFARIA